MPTTKTGGIVSITQHCDVSEPESELRTSIAVIRHGKPNSPARSLEPSPPPSTPVRQTAGLSPVTLRLQPDKGCPGEE